MKLKSIVKSIVLLAIFGSLFSCGSKKDIVYFQNIDLVGTKKSINKYTPTIKPDDMLTIIVSALDQDLARPFNLSTVSFVQNENAMGRQTQQTYLVDSNGNIDFPVLGTIKVAGLTRIQATELIKKMVAVYVKNPIVNIRNVNFKVTVLGEVNRPGTFTITNERLTILEALGLAGDMTIQGERKNVLVTREVNGKTTTTRLDLTSSSVFDSPVYYLSQNDVIYVQPNNSRVKSSGIGPNTNATLSIIGTLISAITATAVIINVTKK